MREYGETKVVDIITTLEATKEHLDEEGWVQGRFATTSGAVCLFGAVSRVTEPGPLRLHTMRQLVLTTTGKHTDDHWRLAHWNDHRRRKVADIYAAVDETIDRMHALGRIGFCTFH